MKRERKKRKLLSVSLWTCTGNTEQF
jgi:hypothetical protein